MLVETQRAVLDAMGVEWYVRRELVSVATTAVADAPIQARIEPIPVAVSVGPTSKLSELVDTADTPAISEPQLSEVHTETKPVVSTTLKSAAQPEVASSHAVDINTSQSQAFNWLVAESKTVQFVCDIKPRKLDGVWHAAAIELLSDIATAMGSKDTLHSRYFNWPVMGPTGVAVPGVELESFLSSFLAPDVVAPVCIVMGETAQQLAGPRLDPQVQLISCATLGELFTQAPAKQALWRKLQQQLWQ